MEVWFLQSQFNLNNIDTGIVMTTNRYERKIWYDVCMYQISNGTGRGAVGVVKSLLGNWPEILPGQSGASTSKSRLLLSQNHQREVEDLIRYWATYNSYHKIRRASKNSCSSNYQVCHCHCRAFSPFFPQPRRTCVFPPLPHHQPI